MSTSTQTATSAKKYNLLITLIILLAPIALSVVPQSYAASPDLVISQVYGGGGNSGAPYTHDFIELFNRGHRRFRSTAFRFNTQAPQVPAILGIRQLR